MFSDIKFALRMLSKDLGYTTTVILTLAVCIGANAAIFTIVNSVLLRPLPIPESDRILIMSNQYPNAGVGTTLSMNSGIPDYYDRLRDVNTFEEQALYSSTGQAIEINGAPERIRGMNTTPSMFRLLRVTPAQGRIFEERDGEVGNEQKVILSYGLWQQLYGADNIAIGRELRLSGRVFTIVGVMPRDFSFVDPEVRFWIPFAFTPAQKSDDQRHNNGWINIGRLKPGASLEQAQAQVNALNAANLDRFPSWKPLLINAGFYTRVDRLQDRLVGRVRRTLYLLFGGAVLVLLIGAVNLTNLTLARSTGRLKEVATRLALGGGRAQIARQFTVESVLLAVFGACGGLAVAFLMLRGLATIGLDRLPRSNEINIDLVVAGFAVVLSIFVGILMAAVPAIRIFKLNLSSLLHEESRTGTSGRKARAIRRLLVVTQIALAFVLLIGAGLLLASFRNLLRVDPGFIADGVVTAYMNVPRTRYADDNQVRLFLNRTLDGIRSIPGVTEAGATTIIPLGGDHTDSVILAEGYEMKPGESLISPMRVAVTPGYFEAMNTRLVRGRYFDEHDSETAPGVIIVDEKLARRFWGEGNPVGKRMRRPDNPNDLLQVTDKTKWLTVAGVVREVQLDDLAGRENSVGAYYLPYAQMTERGFVLAIKGADPAAVVKAVRGQLAKTDPEIPLFDIRTMSERMEGSLVPRKTAMLLAAVFGCVSLFLSALGIYGVLAYLVAQRTREIGIRVALGSTNSGIFKLVLYEGLLLVACGLGLGLAGATTLRSTLQNQIYGIGAMDPVIIAIVMGVLGSIALAACILPARRATRIDPVSALN